MMAGPKLGSIHDPVSFNKFHHINEYNFKPTNIEQCFNNTNIHVGFQKGFRGKLLQNIGD